MSQPEQLPTVTCPTAQGSLAQGIGRRAVIRGAGIAGVGVVGAVTLAACGGGSDTATPTSAPAGGAASSAAPAGGAIKVADIPVGGGKVFEAEKIVVTQPKAGEFKAFSAICTHAGCSVDKVADGTIDCPCHASKFDMSTGAVTSGPAPSPLPARTATAKGDSITVS